MSEQPLIDVVIPTQFRIERRWTLIHQIKSALNQEIPARVVILSSEKSWLYLSNSVMESLTANERANVINFIHADGGTEQGGPLGYMCNPALLAYMESGLAAAWQLQSCDDDCLTPWALKSLLGASQGVSMVLGRAVAVSRKYEDRREYKLNEAIERCHVGLAAAIIKTEDVMKLAPPRFNIFTGYGDWELIKRMSDTYPFRFIDQIVNVQGLTL